MTSYSAEAAEALAQALITARTRQSKEAVGRAIIHGGLPRIFPGLDDAQWLRHYSLGEEAHTRAEVGGRIRSRFIDTLVNSTVIEYERDLNDKALAAHGREELVEKTSGLLQGGAPPDLVRAILSDGVVWTVYDVATVANPPTASRAEDITLREVAFLDICDSNQRTTFPEFLRRHLGRLGVRQVNAESLAADLGLNSPPFLTSAGPALTDLIREARVAYPAADLAIRLWAGFVGHLNGGASGVGEDNFAAELYLTLLARLFCANVLKGRVLVSTESDLRRIVSGRFFEDEYRLRNVVEHDYFWWATQEPWMARLIVVASEIQRDLAAYDFAHLPTGDLFGRLMAQLANASQRQLLGQEWTPQWLAAEMAQAAFGELAPETLPRFVDMCCGSGAILAEILREARDRGQASAIEDFASVVTGFDIDALAVVLAKTTWVLTLANEIPGATSEIVIPIYHADSLFASAPTTKQIPDPESKAEIPVDLDGVTIAIPAWMIGPETRDLFDRSVEWTYESAMEAERDGTLAGITEDRARGFFDDAVRQANVEASDTQRADGGRVLGELARRMGELAIEQRDGIWAFILRNVYRPGLLAGHFNGLVSNPPWLTLSRLAGNPYRAFLRARAMSFGILPRAQAALHLELATTYLLHAVDRFLEPGAVVVSVLPGTVLNGAHHQRFRDAAWLHSSRSLSFALTEVWEIAQGTFKYPAIVGIGGKYATAAIESLARMPRQLQAAYLAESGRAPVTWVEQGVSDGSQRRTAWRLETAAGAVRNLTYLRGAPQQGADLMPRIAVVVDVIMRSGREYRVNTPNEASPNAYAVAGAKLLADQRIPGAVAPEYLFDMVQSNHVLPFVVDARPTPIALPALLDDQRQWLLREIADIRAEGNLATARRFQRIDEILAGVNTGHGLLTRVSTLGKLVRQQFKPDALLVLYGAGGTYPAAARFRLSQFPRAVFDQTVYWHVAASLDEARFIVAMLNSPALDRLTAAFNPEGSFGGRHLHTVPFRLTPIYNPDDSTHARVVRLCAEIEATACEAIAADPMRFALAKPIAHRRSALRTLLGQDTAYAALVESTTLALNVAHAL